MLSNCGNKVFISMGTIQILILKKTNISLDVNGKQNLCPTFVSAYIQQIFVCFIVW